MKKTIENDAVLIADSHHGQYIPMIVIESEINNPNWDWSKCSPEDIQAVLNGTEDEWYWDAWNNIQGSVKITAEGVEYFLFQNEDLWAIPIECRDQLEDWII